MQKTADIDNTNWKCHAYSSGKYRVQEVKIENFFPHTPKRGKIKYVVKRLKNQESVGKQKSLELRVCTSEKCWILRDGPNHKLQVVLSVLNTNGKSYKPFIGMAEEDQLGSSL